MIHLVLTKKKIEEKKIIFQVLYYNKGLLISVISNWTSATFPENSPFESLKEFQCRWKRSLKLLKENKSNVRYIKKKYLKKCILHNRILKGLATTRTTMHGRTVRNVLKFIPARSADFKLGSTWVTIRVPLQISPCTYIFIPNAKLMQLKQKQFSN